MGERVRPRGDAPVLHFETRAKNLFKAGKLKEGLITFPKIPSGLKKALKSLIAACDESTRG
jgi:hypothetical protein